MQQINRSEGKIYIADNVCAGLLPQPTGLLIKQDCQVETKGRWLRDCFSQLVDN